MSFFNRLLQCYSSPRLYSMYLLKQDYQPNKLESTADKVIKVSHFVWYYFYGKYVTLLAFMYLLGKGHISHLKEKDVAVMGGAFGSVILAVFTCRAVGRAVNYHYIQFLNVLYKSNDIAAIRNYDFDFTAWPVEFSVRKNRYSIPPSDIAVAVNEHLPIYKRLIIRLLAFLAMKTFAMYVIYPGTLRIVQFLGSSSLAKGRKNLVTSYKGKRAKIETAEGNHIDTMFVDYRGQYKNGKNLIIFSEGNSAFYEIGGMFTGVSVKYSSLGWNHPGFACSTGFPFPDQEQNAIDAVVKYAISDLEFKIEDIILYGWSIGGYTAAWAATKYPGIHLLILDATFNDLLPLALVRTPDLWGPMVAEFVRTYVNLDIAELVCKYSGPVKIFRRISDEIICLREGDITSNLGNRLVTKLILNRHSDVTSAQRLTALVETYTTISQLNKEDIAEDEVDTVDLIETYMLDLEGSHCDPLSGYILESAINQSLGQRYGDVAVKIKTRDINSERLENKYRQQPVEEDNWDD